MKLQSSLAAGTFLPIRTATIEHSGARVITAYAEFNLEKGAPFGGSSWVKEKPDENWVQKHKLLDKQKQQRVKKYH